SKRPAIGGGSCDRNGTYFGTLIWLGESITSGPTIVGEDSGGTGVAAATGAGGPAAAGEPLDAGVALALPSTHALWWPPITSVDTSTAARRLTVDIFAPLPNSISFLPASFSHLEPSNFVAKRPCPLRFYGTRSARLPP